MSYFAEWNERINQQDEQALGLYAKEYYGLEQEAYRQILESYPEGQWSGRAIDLAQRLGFGADKMDIFLGFLEGINSSLQQEIDLEGVTDETTIQLDIDYEKLYWNMHEAQAKWLYELAAWEGVIPAARRRELTRDFNREHIAVRTKVGRNDPCPCGSGKKYKACCARKAAQAEA